MNNFRFNILLPLIIAVSICIGVVVGNFYARRSFGTTTNVGKGGMNKLNAIFGLIEEKYVDTVDMHNLIEDAIPDIIAQLDPHSVYIPASEMDKVREGIEGSFSGIGVQFNLRNDTIFIVGVISGGPSEKQGILPGDKIVEVNDSVFVGPKLTEDVILKKLKGKKGTPVKVGIKRNGEKKTLQFNIVRDDVPLTSIDAFYMMDDKKTGYIRVNKFAANTYKEFRNAIAQLKAEGSTQMILDFRGNGGGLLDAAINMVNEFLPGNRLIVYTKGRTYRQQNAFSDGTGICQDIKTVVLIDEFTASASEIFAGALQDNDRATIVGRRSYGKGLVQQDIPFSDNSALRLTIARYYTPSGRFIQKPYTKGNDEEYDNDILNRFAHGEFFEKDSVKIADSIKYYTVGGRVVYGGGGIIPDIFVPSDTSYVSSYFNKLVNYGIIYQYVIDYTDNNREILKQYKTKDELLAYVRTQNLLDGLVDYADKKGVRKNVYGLKRSEYLLKNRMEAYIVRVLLSDKEFFQVYNEPDNMIKKAVQILDGTVN